MTDREKVIKGLEGIYRCISPVNYTCGDCPYQDNHVECKRRALNDALALLKEQEAKTGHWIEKEDYNFDTYYDCSVCGESWSMIDGTPWENGMYYCPHCGAKMEGR